MDRHVRAHVPQLFHHVQAARVVGVYADREAGATGGMGSQLVQGDGLDGARAEPEQDDVGDAQVLVLPAQARAVRLTPQPRSRVGPEKAYPGREGATT
ncbi:hypothetical protein BIV23_38620 [Streptomyces monashensis]|uniref:Uncharacterized protein n=1 Tax=Streptomyces monashensis TaxID=1678012 RepID=A0A1S2PEQ8_9ACTN|nr:hypothetical protein BIV23_38620 [Streptomyces monashensis]